MSGFHLRKGVSLEKRRSSRSAAMTACLSRRELGDRELLRRQERGGKNLFEEYKRLYEFPESGPFRISRCAAGKKAGNLESLAEARRLSLLRKGGLSRLEG